MSSGVFSEPGCTFRGQLFQLPAEQAHPGAAAQDLVPGYGENHAAQFVPGSRRPGQELRHRVQQFRNAPVLQGVEKRFRLGLDALRRVHQQHRRVQHPEGPLDLRRKTRMSGRMHVEKGATLYSYQTEKTYAAEDGKVTGVFAQAGDDAETVSEKYGADLYIIIINTGIPG